MALLSDYDYELPEGAIAQSPLEDRAASKLLWLHRNGNIEHRAFREVPQLLLPGDLLVMNNTRVTALRLVGQKLTGGRVELLLLKKIEEGLFETLAKPAARLKVGTQIRFSNGLQCMIQGNLRYGGKIVRFESEPLLETRLQELGSVPLPPYIHAKLEDSDRYQTVYASAPGSAAAPTAGLHFTKEVLDQLVFRAVSLAWVTLDVGLDTFRPVKVEELSEHQMHGEKCSLPGETARAIEECKGRIVAVGTTAVRTLESFATGKRKVSPGMMTTNIFIHPGYEFNVIDGMFTNFHMPRTTMLMMLAAFVGRESLFNAYNQALEHQYRFLSFGDSMLIV